MCYLDVALHRKVFAQSRTIHADHHGNVTFFLLSPTNQLKHMQDDSQDLSCQWKTEDVLALREVIRVDLMRAIEEEHANTMVILGGS